MVVIPSEYVKAWCRFCFYTRDLDPRRVTEKSWYRYLKAKKAYIQEHTNRMVLDHE